MTTKKPKYFVYILRCADASLYTGVTNDIPHRLKEHNRGKGSAYVRSRLPAKLVYKEKNYTDILKTAEGKIEYLKTLNQKQTRIDFNE